MAGTQVHGVVGFGEKWLASKDTQMTFNPSICIMPSEQIAEYVGSFFYRYLPVLVNSNAAIKLEVGQFLSLLKLDEDCRELFMFA